MNELVYLDSDDLTETPFTTSNVIAENGCVQHETVVRLIVKHESDLQEFGRLRFEIGTLNTNGGAQGTKSYHLNEQQATLLITFMKNTAPVIRFKKALVREFYRMQEELMKRRLTREIGKQARTLLTEAIQALPETPMKAMVYKNFTDLVYTILLGKNAKQLRQFFGIEKGDDIRNHLSCAQLETICKMEQFISTLVEAGLNYQAIKAIVTRKWASIAA